jgi:hypothetical protein
MDMDVHVLAIEPAMMSIRLKKNSCVVQNMESTVKDEVSVKYVKAPNRLRTAALDVKWREAYST